MRVASRCEANLWSELGFRHVSSVLLDNSPPSPGLSLTIKQPKDKFNPNPDLRVSSVQCGLPSPAESSFTPESCRSLVFRSSSFRLEELELRTEARASQHLSDRWQAFILQTNKKNNMLGTVIKITYIFKLVKNEGMLLV